MLGSEIKPVSPGKRFSKSEIASGKLSNPWSQGQDKDAAIRSCVKI